MERVNVSANRKVKFVLFMMLGEEGQRRFEQRHPLILLKNLKFDDFLGEFGRDIDPMSES